MIFSPNSKYQARPWRCCKEYEGWLRERLQYSNEPNLRRRLNDLVGKAEELLTGFIADHKKFIDRVVVTRNFFIHHDQKLPDKVLRGANLYWTKETLSYVIQACLLTELGFSTEKCRVFFERNARFRYVRSELYRRTT
jgi:hypothetical protein